MQLIRSSSNALPGASRSRRREARARPNIGPRSPCRRDRANWRAGGREPIRVRRWRLARPRPVLLNRKRSLSIGMIRRLHDHLGISAEVLIRPSRNEQPV